MQRQLGYILGSQKLVLGLEEFEDDDDLLELIGNVHVSFFCNIS